MDDMELLNQCDQYAQSGDGGSLLSFVEANRYEFEDPCLYYMQKSNALSLLNLNDEALACASIAYSLYPNNPVASMTLGLCYSAINQPEKALPHFKNAMKLGEHSVFLYQNLGRCEHALGHTKKAIEYFKSIDDNYPMDVYTTIELATLYFEQKDYNAAYNYYSIGFVNNWLVVDEMKNYAQCTIELGLISQAYMILASIYTNDPSTAQWVDAEDIKITINYFEDYEGAQEQLKVYLKSYPDDDWGKIQMAYCAAKSDHLRRCKNYLGKIRSFQDDPLHYRLARSILFQSKQDYDSAINEMKTLTDVHAHTDATMQLANLYVQTNQTSDAITLLKKSRKINAYQPSVNALLNRLEKEKANSNNSTTN